MPAPRPSTCAWVQLHACILQLGYEDNLILNTALVDLYAKCDAIVDARRVFYGLEWHDRVSWTSIICRFSKNGHQRDATLMFKDTLGTQIKLNSYTHVGVISACSELKKGLEQGSLLHAHVFKLGFDKNNFVASSLIDCYSKWGEIVQAALVVCDFRVFEEFIQRGGSKIVHRNEEYEFESK